MALRPPKLGQDEPPPKLGQDEPVTKDGPASECSIYRPWTVVCDQLGNVFVSTADDAFRVFNPETGEPSACSGPQPCGLHV